MASRAASASANSSLQNLGTVANLEYNAAARYAAYALQADQEGYLRLGSLFRAISRSEQIHASNHTATLIKLGGAWSTALEPFPVSSTIENLQAAIQDEFYEMNEVFPGFLREAEAQALFDAERTLTYAIASEVSHVQLFVDAMEELQESNPSMIEYLSHTQRYGVCPVCGFIAQEPASGDCPVCGHARDAFDYLD